MFEGKCSLVPPPYLLASVLLHLAHWGTLRGGLVPQKPFIKNRFSKRIRSACTKHSPTKSNSRKSHSSVQPYSPAWP